MFCTRPPKLVPLAKEKFVFFPIVNLPFGIQLAPLCWPVATERNLLLSGGNFCTAEISTQFRKFSTLGSTVHNDTFQGCVRVFFGTMEAGPGWCSVSQVLMQAVKEKVLKSSNLKRAGTFSYVELWSILWILLCQRQTLSKP